MRKVSSREREGGRGHAQEGLHAWLFPPRGRASFLPGGWLLGGPLDGRLESFYFSFIFIFSFFNICLASVLNNAWVSMFICILFAFGIKKNVLFLEYCFFFTLSPNILSLHNKLFSIFLRNKYSHGSHNVIIGFGKCNRDAVLSNIL